MIKIINKPVSSPEILYKRGEHKGRNLLEVATEQIQNSYETDPDEYDNGQKSFEFNSDVYGHKEIKNSLINAQFDKCCFCEAKITHISYGDVEHFRPKAGYCQDESDGIQPPGYYWLAYDWDNLLLSCQLCNQRFKKNLFHWKTQTLRAKNHHHQIENEIPVFINPVHEDPQEHIGFREEMPFGITERGKISIKALGLDRDKLNEERRRLFTRLKVLVTISRFPDLHSDRERQLLREHLASSIQSDQPYSSMVQSNFAHIITQL